jgi:Tfp pilus assembly protein PilF
MTRRAVRCLGAALAPLLASACVTERIIERPAAPPCDPATGANCPPPPRQLSPREQEELVLEDECGRNAMESCVELGRLLMEDGNLPRAEIPLRKAYRDDNAAAAAALAELYDRRGEPVRAEEMRWAAPAIDKANS